VHWKANHHPSRIDQDTYGIGNEIHDVRDADDTHLHLVEARITDLKDVEELIELPDCHCWHDREVRMEELSTWYQPVYLEPQFAFARCTMYSPAR
jgi:hypothetical protein